MGDTGLGRHRRSSGVTSERCYSHYGGVLFRRRKAAPDVCLNPAKHEQPTCMATFFRVTATWDTEKRARQWVSIYANREKLAPPFHRRMGMQTKSHTHRENIGSGGGSIQVSFANAHKTGTHYWAVYTGLHLLDIFFSTLGGSHTFLFSTGTSTFFCSFSSRSQSFPPKALGGLTGGHHWAGRMDLGGFRMAWKPGKGGRGGGFVSLPG